MTTLSPYFVKAWMTGESIGESYPTRQSAFCAARALGHSGKLAENGAYYLPVAYVVDSDGDYVGCPVFLLPSLNPISEEAHYE